MQALPAPARSPCPTGDYPAFYPDPAPFDAALEATAGVAPRPTPVTGLVVPHHLNAPDLIASGLRLGSGQRPRRIVLLFPDHFAESPRPFATTTHGFRTVLGAVPTDAGAARTLLADPDLVADSCLFGSDHGARALLPFLARLYPGVPVLPLAIGNGSNRADWDAMARALTPLIDAETLLIQSTDFSHYLPWHEARQRDQEVLNLLAAGDLDGIARLVQPDHVDSVGALYLTMALERRLFGAGPQVVANRNQQQGVDQFLSETTSYMVILYQPEGLPPVPAPLAGAHRYVLAGDWFLGRTWPGLLYDELVAGRVERAALEATGGLPLIANLEGVLLPDLPGTLDHMTLAMPAELVVDWARRLNVAGFGLANNHAMDIGTSGMTETLAALDAAGIPHAAQGERLQLPGLTLVILSDLDGAAMPPWHRLDEELLDRVLVEDASVPVLAFLHWGAEWVTEPRPREQMLTREIEARGAAALVGAHPHAASAGPRATPGGRMLVIQSLGNFLFDQHGPGAGGLASGALAEVTAFDQGTIFLRQIPAPQLYDIARGRQ
nr:AmmeMemoRadiSam system protein B [Frigidibacter sp. ROC022]